MPSKSAKQHRLMEAAAHTPGGYGGVPQSVGREYVAADKSSHRDLHRTVHRRGDSMAGRHRR